MEQYAIHGGQPLIGEVEIGGAKNAALAILAAAIMTDDVVTIENVPDVRDTKVMLEAIESIGGRVEHIDRHTVKIDASKINDFIVDGEAVKKIRASYYFLGALLGKKNKACVVLPGGCNIGQRPIDMHLKGFRALGAKNEIIGNGRVETVAEKLTGAHIYMDVVTVGATMNVMMAAVLAEGKTIIENAAKEPHIVDLANFLNSMGAKVKGAGTDVIRITGVESLHGSTYAIIPDQIEAGTYMMAAAITNGNVTVKNVIPRHLESISAKLSEIGCKVIESDDSVQVIGTSQLTRTHIKTLPYPGFPTDMQPQMAVALALSDGTSIVTESIFENRFKYVGELLKMGADINVQGNSAIIEGVSCFKPAPVVAPDLRAGAALVLAALAADGFSTVEDIRFIERGYEDFPEKLRALGGNISKVDSEEELNRFKFRVVS